MGIQEGLKRQVDKDFCGRHMALLISKTLEPGTFETYVQRASKSTDRRVVLEAIMHPISTAVRIYNCATLLSPDAYCCINRAYTFPSIIDGMFRLRSSARQPSLGRERHVQGDKMIKLAFSYHMFVQARRARKANLMMVGYSSAIIMSNMPEKALDLRKTPKIPSDCCGFLQVQKGNVHGPKT